MKWIMVASIFLLTCFTALGDSYLKRAGQYKNTNLSYLMIGIIVYITTGIIWFFIYKQAKFSVIGSVYGVATALVFAIVGIFYFKEVIKPQEILGIIMAITSIILLGRFGN